MRRALGPGTPQPWPPEWGRWVIKAERTAYPKLLKQAHELSPLSWRETAQRRSIISLNTHAADQTRSRPRRLHCGFDLAAPSHYHDNSDRFSFSFAGQQALKDTVENARVREYADTENEQLSIFLRFRGPKALSDRVESREAPLKVKGLTL